MFDFISEMFSYEFITRSLFVGLLISMCSSLLGVSLVLKRYSMIGDGLSHVGFGAVAIATALNIAPLQLAIPLSIFSAFFLLRINENSKIKGDSAIALLSAGSLAIGVIVISLSEGMNVDVYNYLFGSILAISNSDVILSVIVAAIVILLFLLFYHHIFAITFDENFSKATGIPVSLYNMMIAILTAITIVIGMRLMGSLLISSFIIFPALTSLHTCKNFKSLTISSLIVAFLTFIIGFTLSYLYAIPTGASIVVVNMTFFFLFWLLSSVPRIRKK